MSEAYILGRGNGVTIKKLWENASPDSSFSGQTINFSFDKSIQKGDIVIAMCNSGTPIVMEFFKDGITNVVTKMFAADYNRREFTFHSTNVRIDNGMEYKYSGGSKVTNNYLVPQSIYVIRKG